MVQRRSLSTGRPKRVIGVFFLLLFLIPGTGEAESAEEIFRSSCVACHTIGGGRLVGPDLKGVTERQERNWLQKFIVDPQSKIAEGDAYAIKLLEEANGVVMAPVPGVGEAQASELLDLIERESALERSRFVGTVSLREFTPEDLERGSALFSAAQSLENGGPACISCHQVSGSPGLGGGRLGPDLTQAGVRLGGAVGLYNWLTSPPTDQMSATFENHPFNEDEIIALTAWLVEVSGKVETPVFSDMNSATFASLGLLGASVILALFGGVWRKRFRAIREPMIRSSNKESLKHTRFSGGQNV
ncbi:MAG: c-type cytochrome [Candidatus Krumholzibacteria bacterium]|jgi:mono/diheme cytochrome c family protein|nr:c-type cytochrome [Candidatus Krumholzibacteria bacterium]